MGDLPRVSAVVLAGGRSRRFGAQKLSVTLGGAPLLHRALLKDLSLTLDEGIEVVGRDELVLGPVDEGHELVEPVLGVAATSEVGQRQVRADVAEQQDLANAVEDVGLRGEASVGCGLGEDTVAEAMEVADVEPSPGGRANLGLDAVAQLLGGLDVVGQDEDLLVICSNGA